MTIPNGTNGTNETNEEECNCLLMGLMTLVILVCLISSLVLGVADSSRDAGCDRPFTKRWHYVVPLRPLFCAGIKFMSEDENIWITKTNSADILND